jgi:hypothetical protein
MKWYNTDEIKSQGDCVRFATEELGCTVKGGRCAALWRGGDNPQTVSIEKTKWYDHKEKAGGSIIDLCAVACTNGDLGRATERLGEWLKLAPTKGLKVVEKKQVVAEYIYTDNVGAPLHKTVRYEPKDFRQFSMQNGSWVPGLHEVETVPYCLPIVHDAHSIIICEGEKDADRLNALGLPATTFPMGADKWQDTWRQWFNGKHVHICRDNDDAGLQHSKRIAWELRDTAEEIRIICPCTDRPKGDVSDFLDSGNGAAELSELIDNTPALQQIAEPDAVTIDKETEKAKAANKTAFTNFYLMEVDNGKGGEKTVPVPRKIMDMVADLNTRLLGFPRRIGETLFDRDRDTGNIRELRNANEFRAWVEEKTGSQCKFKRLEGGVNWDTLLAAVHANSIQYEGISYAPGFPTRQEIHYTHPTMPKPSEGHEYFNRLMRFFNPESEADALLPALFVRQPDVLPVRR